MAAILNIVFRGSNVHFDANHVMYSIKLVMLSNREQEFKVYFRFTTI